ncbi:4-sulfomuconolactone hydrolase [Pirellula sp. SH-Sr6A]|uniref:amidohydrolase family protein n=1 Tax=Pirellula sp. SH-Sr6A TaxID=1632865 RepID=UPI00078D9D64|nr:amidohydrolase family protein [Pirellula sp. SH-Sr6A]AMV32719.1 4-sulfomuconolactone hydrolase [Pirellula sp. SH-Sr6A]
MTLDRRSLLQGGIGAAACSALSTLSTEGYSFEKDSDQQWIDAHVHVWTGDTQTYPLAEGFTREQMQPGSFTPSDLFSHCRPQGVSKIVLIQMNFYTFDNRYMLDVMEKHPGVFSGVAIIDESSEDAPKQMAALKQKGVRGFRLYADQSNVSKWKTSQAMRRMWAAAADLNLAMCCLANPDALPGILAFAKEYPKTRVVIDHFARIGIDGTMRDTDLDHLKSFVDREETYIKTSAFYALGKKKPPYDDLGPMIQKLVTSFGSERLMWASDCPFQIENGHTYGASIDLIRNRLAFLTAEDTNNLLKNTAAKVFFSV